MKKNYKKIIKNGFIRRFKSVKSVRVLSTFIMIYKIHKFQYCLKIT